MLDSLGGKYFSAALESLDPMGRIVHFGATSAYGGAKDGLFGLRKWLTLLPGYLSRPWVDPGQLTPANRTAASYSPGLPFTARSAPAAVHRGHIGPPQARLPPMPPQSAGSAAWTPLAAPPQAAATPRAAAKRCGVPHPHQQAASSAST